ncbi:MAG: hypothetical protein JWO33_384 [Caulobacteraceae bacterium]|nr:hypothetical protein [Caulobacteraceae bacterium]
MVKEAEALAEVGHQVRVISTRSLELVDRRDDEILASASWSSTRIDLRRGRMRRKLRSTWLAGLQRLAGPMEFAYAPAVTELVGHARAHPADLYIAHYVAALPAVARAARTHGGRFAYDAEDFHLGDPPEDRGFDRERAAIRAIEGRYLDDCAYMTAASPGIADAYAQAYGVARPTVVLNVFPRSQGVAAPTPRGDAEPGPSIYWFSQTLGPDRGLECAVKAIALARSRPHLYLRGDPTPGYVDHLAALGRSVGVPERLHFLEPEPPSKMAELASAYDLGLVAETGFTPNHRIALSNKQFTYLLAGVPALLSDTPGHCAIAEQAEGAAFLFRSEDAGSLAEQVDRLLGDPEALAQARRRAFELGRTRFNWEIEKATLLDCVSRALRSPGPARP